MNAAARLVHQGALTRHLVFTYLLTRRQIAMLMLTLAVLMSALSMIYVTHTTREMYASYQHNLAEQNRLHVQRGQLLLERSTWMMQARIQKMAEEKLGMVIPDHHSVQIISE
ncbi:cell division protein FtsL [Aquicella lusitana]|jgi:cell division protein FtsL|uniref:Cell division protein FtsL n=1 Tax=Aquicella lusitana TaxID=254246 RepID=A0A370GN73_9COXI|nr:cell division protein FtsL [Aquicella lusitana]RDI44769.1 cell division protein FtsL [Aquicella lusitana]VVC72966.1 Cell division protein FtsL [Aquicella lusitana]